MYEKSEVCTKAMFSMYKSRANQQWINGQRSGVYKADWEEGVEPTFQGTTDKVSDKARLCAQGFSQIAGADSEYSLVPRNIKRSKILKIALKVPPCGHALSTCRWAPAGALR